ncbi:accessory factor UbiK family protein [Lacibacterium aquatile]|uniref:Accessory factor UbiK family protein n=1 Tax=Lacibacterium aquatile TaxID=1168082 RepID=A0ABW5E028_9PROT
MIGQGRLFEDMSKVAGGAMGALSGLRGEVETMIKARVEKVASEMGLARQDEVDAALAMASKAREAEESMADRLAALEEKVGELEAKLAAKPKRKAEDSQGKDGAE